jgi:hypothetical protein
MAALSRCTTPGGRDFDGTGSSSFAANIHRYPGFRQIALSWGDWAEQGVRVADNSFAEGYKEEVLRRLSELEKEQPNPDADLA